MWSRAELKANAKVLLKNNYWECILAFLVYGAITIGVSLVASLFSFFLPFAGMLATLFLTLPLSVGVRYFFMQNQIAPARIQNIFYAFKRGGYGKITGAMAWMYLFIVLWSLISMAGFFILMVKAITSIIPALMSNGVTQSLPAIDGNWSMFDGSWSMLIDSFPMFDSSWIPALAVSIIIYLAGMIIAYTKVLSYSMTAYILTDNPVIGYERALKLSIAMTNGHKWKIFVLYLSFIGWGLLALLTFGIGFLFLAPYVSATEAELYVKLRDSAISCGLTSPQELNVLQK